MSKDPYVYDDTKVLKNLANIKEQHKLDDYETTMSAMDEMEGFISEGNPENEYHKVILEVENLHTNEKENCFVYFYNKDKDPLFDSNSIYVPHGDWKKHMHQEQSLELQKA